MLSATRISASFHINNFILATLYISSWNSTHYSVVLSPKIAVSIITDTINYYHTFRGFSRNEIILLETLSVPLTWYIVADNIICKILIFPKRRGIKSQFDEALLYFTLSFFSCYFQNMQLKISKIEILRYL